MRVCVTQASPTWFSSRTCRSEPSRAAVSTTPLLRSHQKRRSSVKSMARPLGESRLAFAMTVRSLPSKEDLSTTGWTPISVQNSFLKSGRKKNRKPRTLNFKKNQKKKPPDTNFAKGWTAIPLGFSSPSLTMVSLFSPARLLQSTVDWL